MRSAHALEFVRQLQEKRMLHDIYYTDSYDDGEPVRYWQIAADNKDAVMWAFRHEKPEARIIRIEQTDYSLL